MDISPMVAALLASLLIMSVSLIGVITLNRLVHDWIHRNLTFLVSFSAGLLSVVVVGLMLEVRESLNYPLAMGSVLAGVVLLYLVNSLLPESHHHHMEDECHSCDEEPKPHANRILAADAIHNIGDGLILVPAYVISPALGISLTLAILVHEAAQELSEYFILRKAGLSRRAALLRNLLAGSFILIGVLLGSVVVGSQFEAVILAMAAGAFAFVISQDLLPHSLSHARKHGLYRHLGWALAGALVMVAIGLLSPHTHATDDPEHTHEDHSHEHVPGDDHTH